MPENAQEFTAKLLNNLCKSYNIKTIEILVQKLCLNGLVEHMNRKVLRAVISPDDVN